MHSCIYLDIGNSNTKWKYEGKYFDTLTNDFSLSKLPKSSKIWISNVSSAFIIESKPNFCIVESQKRYKSLVNSYEKPNTLGSDRWLAMIASYEKNPSKGFILVDIGTAVTFDLVHNSGLHAGGVIFPGLHKIRETFDNFPISNEIKTNNIGQSTIEAWSTGTLDLIVNGINRKVHDIKISEPDVDIYLTGGGVSDLEKFLDFSYVYSKNLVLDGLELFANNMR